MKTALQEAARAASANSRGGLIVKLEAVQDGIIVRGRAPFGVRFRTIEQHVTYADICSALDEHVLADAVRLVVIHLGFAVIDKMIGEASSVAVGDFSGAHTVAF